MTRAARRAGSQHASAPTSQDRYANMVIAYLLQLMEECDGIVVLATNLKKNLDEAFVRLRRRSSRARLKS